MKNINVIGRKQRKILDICQHPYTLLYSVLWQVESIASFSTWCPLCNIPLYFPLSFISFLPVHLFHRVPTI